MTPEQGLIEAKRRIREAFESGAGELDLRELRLSELPEELAHLTQLAVLDVGQNKLEALPEWLGNLTQLTTLLAHNNKVRSLPEGLRRLVALEKLFQAS